MLIFIIGWFATNTCDAQSDPGFTEGDADTWDNLDPGGEVPIPGVAYFMIAALAIGAKKVYDMNKKVKKADDFQ